MTEQKVNFWPSVRPETRSDQLLHLSSVSYVLHMRALALTRTTTRSPQRRENLKKSNVPVIVLAASERAISSIHKKSWISRDGMLHAVPPTCSPLHQEPNPAASPPVSTGGERNPADSSRLQLRSPAPFLATSGPAAGMVLLPLGSSFDLYNLFGLRTTIPADRPIVPICLLGFFDTSDWVVACGLVGWIAGNNETKGMAPVSAESGRHSRRSVNHTRHRRWRRVASEFSTFRFWIFRVVF